MRFKTSVMLGCFLVLVFFLPQAGHAEELAELSKQDVEGVSSRLKSIKYELEWTYFEPSGQKASFAFRFWSQGEKWRAERDDYKDGKASATYVQSFDGQNYQFLNYSTGQLQFTSKIYPKSPAFPSSFYDNAPLQLLGFLNYVDRTVLPSNLKAIPIKEGLDPARWAEFFKVANKVTDTAGEAGTGASQFRLENAQPDKEFSTFSVITFGQNSKIFPSSVKKFFNNTGPRSMEVDVSEYKDSGLPGLSIPSKMLFKWYTPRKGNDLVYSAEVSLKALEVNPDIPDEKFTVDLNLASEVWDMDNRVTLPTGKN